MTDKEKLLESTESYLKSLISEVANISVEDNDSSTPFQELGIDSFRVLQIIKKLEEEFGTLPKTLLFENFNISDLSHYFVNKHEQALSEKFAKGKQASTSPVHSISRPVKQAEIVSKEVVSQNNKSMQKTPILILEKEAYKYPELGELIKKIFSQYKNEGSASRGTRNIAPNLFIGSEKRGYFNYSRSKNIILVYAFTGPIDYFPVIAEEMYLHCVNNKLEFNFFSADPNVIIGNIPFSATPFGAIQRILDIQNFTLQGGKMRRLRYQVAKFEEAGKCRTEEYHCGSNKEIDNNIASIIDQWCAPRTMVNPLIHIVKEEILAGNLSPEHRLFLTFLDDVLQNVILISSLSSKENGYLMDLEFYPQNMPLGGLEFGIVKIIEILAAEGCSMLSMGGTYGCKLAPSSNADPELDKTLDYLREQNIFNDEGNLQFKNKFRTENSTIFLCRAKGNSNPDNVTDIIMMIADPSKMQTSDEEHHNFSTSQQQVSIPEEKIERRDTRKTSVEINSDTQNQPEEKQGVMIEGEERSIILSDFGFNPLNIPDNQVEFDLKTDSWSQLEMPAIQSQMRHLHGHLQQPVNLDEILRSIFPFSHFALTTSGRTAEYAFCKSWTKKGIVLQNLLFPTTIFHQIDNGFTPQELPISEIFNLDSNELFKGNLDWEALQKQVDQTPEQVAYVCIEVDDNAAGGGFVSMEHLKKVKTLLSKYSIPLVIDGTRIVENAQFIIEHEKGFTGKNIWDVVCEIFSYADAIVTSLTKDFCVNKGGLIATNDTNFFNKLQSIIQEKGIGLDVIDKKVIALSLQNRKQIESQVLHRMEWVQMVWKALKKHNIPIVQSVGGHCILIDVKQISEFKQFKYPVASFVAWMFLNTGIRAGAHSVGMQKNTTLNDLVRLAIPIGFNREQIEVMIDRLISLFERKENIPEILIDSQKSESVGDINSNYILKKYHNVSGSVIPKASISIQSSKNNSSSEKPLISDSISNSKKAESNQDARSKKSYQSQDIAIVGMSGRYPKAKNLNELWENLVQGKDCIETIPDVRFEQRMRNGFSKKYRGGFITDVDKFDSMFFNIPPAVAEMFDPQERLLLETAWEAIEDAGYYPEILTPEDTPRNIGVFVGAVWTTYQVIGTEEKMVGNYTNPNSFLWSVANRVSYCLNLSGPSLSVDTACSSSLTALYLACEAINNGECLGAIVGGVNLDLHQSKFDINSFGGALSPDGVCRTFGKGANGYVAGEGVGAIFLKPLDQAEKDGDNIQGVIKSVAINHGGRTSGYMVPNPKAQTSLILSALEKANIDARSIGYIEAHGTGTELGDPIEISGLTNAFQKYEVENQSCSIGSVKTNIGHLEAAAGVVGVQKVLLQMKHRKLVPSLHSSELNEFIDFQNSPFYVEQIVEDWKPKNVDGVQFPLRAGISSFGAGGTNAHVIIESYESYIQQQKHELTQHKQQIFPLSAVKEDRLHEAAVRLRSFIKHDLAIETPSMQLDLNDIGFTLRIGRKSFEHRLAIIAGTKEELVEKLTLFIDGKKDDYVLSGHVQNIGNITKLLNRKEKEGFVKLVSESDDPRKLAQLWVEGILTDWQGLQTSETGRRISLPTYPFADKRHWVERQKNANIVRVGAGSHPLIDANESTFERQIFKKTFTDKEFFIYDHLVSDIPTLPGVAYLDFARKAGELAAGRKVQKIKNIIWLSPLTVKNSMPTEAWIELKPDGENVHFEVFSEGIEGKKQLHSQGKLSYATKQDLEAEPEYIDIESIRSRCAKVMDGKDAYPLFKTLGLNLGPSFQVLQEVFKNEDEMLGLMKIPDVRSNDYKDFILHPSLVDGTGQTTMAAQLAGKETTGEMFVPYSFGEVEILNPLTTNCYSYVKKVNDPNSKVSKANLLIVDETGKLLVRIKDSVGVSLVSVHEKPSQNAGDEKIANSGEDDFSNLYYTHVWEKSSFDKEKIHQNNLDYILLFDSDEKLRNLYQDRLKKAGDDLNRIVLVQPGGTYEDLGKQTYRINPHNPKDYIQLLESLQEQKWNFGKICFAWTNMLFRHEESFLKESLEKGVFSFLYLCQSIIEQKLDNKFQLLYLYYGKKGEYQPHNDAINGFARTLQIEHSKLICKTLEIQQEEIVINDVLDAVLAEFHQNTQDDLSVRYEEQERFIRKLRQVNLEDQESSSLPQNLGLKEQGVYIITGGAGGLGFIFAEFLAKECNARLILTGRSTLSSEQSEKLEKLKKLGSEIMYLPTDISNYEEVKKLIKESKSKFGQINGIIHSAGVLRDSYIKNKTLEEMSAVFAPKIYGSFYLDEVTKGENLDFFVMFSSMAAVGGNMGQSDYSFANHFMDSFAKRRAFLQTQGERSGKTLSFNWSIWADGGMKLDAQMEGFFKKNLGIRPLSIETGVGAFAKGLHSVETQLVVVEGMQDRMEQAWGLRKKEIPVPIPTNTSESSVSTAPSSGVQESDGELIILVQNELSRIAMNFLKLDADDISLDKILLDIGFDSIGLSTYANSINEKYKLDVTPVLFFEYPSIREIVKYLVKEHANEVRQAHKISGTSTSNQAAVSTTQTVAKVESFNENSFAIKKGWNSSLVDQNTNRQPSSGGISAESRFIDMPIAIVGISCVMPLSENTEEYWDNLRNATNMITVVPRDRWNWEDYDGDPFKEKNKTNSRWGGFIKDVDKFDPLFFGISPREAEMMDPQQRVFLETVWKVIEDSGHKVSDLSGTKTGLFVGVAVHDYADLMNTLQVALDGYTASGNSHCMLVNRISFLLNLRGPSAPIDTACSSSLIAVHRAIESIHTGSSDMAIVGGVQLMLTPAAHISFGMAGMLSDDGKCKTFDKRANGYVRGEGSGAVFLKPLSKAEADGDHIYAVIKGTAENHGGHATMVTAPNPNAQAELIVEAYQKAQVDPTTVGYIECHGTGTSLGDPIEVQALSKSFSELYKKHNKAPATTPHCGLSSVKTNIGHLETAAGVSSLIKALLAIEHKQIPASLNFEELNPYINLKGTPFYIVDKTKQWEAIKGEDGTLLPRRAGVSSFGFGGANVHVVLEEYPCSTDQSSIHIEGPYAIVLSAKNIDRLKAYAQLMLAHVEKHEIDLADFAYTLQVGRDAMAERLGLVVTSVEQLKEKLRAYINGESNIEDIYQGKLSRKKEVVNVISPDGNDDSQEVIIDKCFANKNFSNLLEAWVKGLDLDWSKLYRTVKPKRVSLPTYPFAKDRYWFDIGDSSTTKDATHAVLHPLLHINTSVLSQQSYSSTFSGKEFFLADYKLQGQKILPAVAYLEMARAAVTQATSSQTTIMELYDIDWMQPIAVTENKQVSIALFEDDDEQIGYEIYSLENEQELIHCQGKALLCDSSASTKLDIEQLKGQMRSGELGPNELYSAFAKMGLSYGASFQGIKSIYQGDLQMLVQLSLSNVVENSLNNYVLHPCLMDSVLQSAICLITNLNQPPVKPSFPFALETLRIVSNCTKEMYAWVRYSRGSRADDKTLKLDIDLMDSQGKICISFKSLTFSNNRAQHSDFRLLLDSIYESNPGTSGDNETENINNKFEKLLERIY
ncbi:MAG: SDR family NAD(P)-dependent oxidoreductase [Bacteroidales bacterium]|nr:SDR family NAD(P)-dependent oxidoreductase [Bacteroidales bacterium]